MATLIFLLVATFLLSIYDLRYRIVPNWVTFLLILVGLVGHFPGTPEIWIGSAILVLSGFLGGGRIGFGDIKLWLAYLWILPLDVAGIGTLIGFQVIFFTALAQVAYFRWRKFAVSQPYPAAWRVFVAVLAVSIKSCIGIYYA